MNDDKWSGTIVLPESRLLKSALMCKKVGGTHTFLLERLLLYIFYLREKSIDDS